MRSSRFQSQLKNKYLVPSDSAEKRHGAVVKQIFASMEQRLSFPLVLFLEGYVLEEIAKIMETTEQEIKERLKEAWHLVDFSTLSKSCHFNYPLLKILKSWLSTPRNFHIAQLN